MVVVKLTNGFGNNLFQFVAAKQLSKYHDQELVVLCAEEYYAKSDLQDLGILSSVTHPSLPGAHSVSENNYLHCFSDDFKDDNFIVNGYFEDYRYYINNLDEIKKWFPKIEKRQDNDLVLHFRAGDRLLYKSTFEHRTLPQRYLAAIQEFEFDNLHVVTDMPKWDYITVKELENLTFHVGVAPDRRVEAHRSVDYFNSFIDVLSKYNPTFKKRTIAEDFNFIRSFDNILFEHGTMGWWASVLSEASRVAVYGPWRSWKGKTNKNLSQVELEGWFQWE